MTRVRSSLAHIPINRMGDIPLLIDWRLGPVKSDFGVRAKDRNEVIRDLSWNAGQRVIWTALS
jgi:hypothetical protein